MPFMKYLSNPQCEADTPSNPPAVDAGSSDTPKYQVQRSYGRTSKYLQQKADSKTKKPSAADAAPAAESDIANRDAGAPNLVHAWIVLLPGKRDVTETTFVEPSSGLAYSPSDSHYTGIEFMWNHENYWVCMQQPEPQSDARAHPATIEFDLCDPTKWEPVLEVPFVTGETVMEAGAGDTGRGHSGRGSAGHRTPGSAQGKSGRAQSMSRSHRGMTPKGSGKAHHPVGHQACLSVLIFFKTDCHRKLHTCACHNSKYFRGVQCLTSAYYYILYCLYSLYMYAALTHMNIIPPCRRPSPLHNPRYGGWDHRRPRRNRPGRRR